MNASINAISRDTQDKIAKLRSKRRGMINTLNFEDAIKIDEEIESHHKSSLEESIQIILDEYALSIEHYIKMSAEKSESYDVEKSKAIRDFRLKFHHYFQDLKQQQLQSLSEIEFKYQETRKRENNRRIPEQAELLEQSKKAAMNGDYQKALELRNNSRIVGQEKIYERLLQLEDDFNQQREDMIKSQRGNLEQLVLKFNNGLELIENKAKSKQEMVTQNRNTQLISSYQKALSKLASLTKMKGIHDHENTLRNILLDILKPYNYECPPIQSINQQFSTSTKKQRTTSKGPTRQSSKRI